MTMEIVPQESAHPLPTPPQPKPRPLARKIASEGAREVWSTVDSKKLRKDRFFARMIWDLITEGQTYLTSGEIMKVRSLEQWTELVKLLTTHLDGPVQKDAITNNINLFKSYAGIDETKV